MTFGFGGTSNRVTVEIVGDSGALKKEFGEARKESQSFAQKASNDLGLLKKAAVGAATGVAAIGATVVGLAVRGGVSRLMGLERAERSLDQLGVAGRDADRLMENLLGTLRGTPFALDKGAQSLAGFVASGRDLKDIPRLIEQVTDAAAFAQAPLEEIDFIWQRIQTTGRATNEELRMLAERNIPVYTQLAGALGVTGEEVFDMASKSELSADIFFDAWERAAEGTVEGTARIKGAAKAMGETTAGAWANMQTAMGRFGATLLEDVFPLAKDVFTAIGEGFDRMGKGLSEAFDNIDTSAVELFIARIPQMMADAAEGVLAFWEATQLLRDIGLAVFEGLTTLIGNKLVLGIGAATLALKAMYAHPVIAGLALVAGAVGEIQKQSRLSADQVHFLTSELQDLSAVQATIRFEEWLTPANIKRFDEVGISIGDVAQMLREGKAGTDEWNRLLGPFMDKYDNAFARLGHQDLLLLIDGLRQAAEIQPGLADATEDTTEAFDGMTDAEIRARDALGGMTRAAKDARDGVVPPLEDIEGAAGDAASRIAAIESALERLGNVDWEDILNKFDDVTKGRESPFFDPKSGFGDQPSSGGGGSASPDPSPNLVRHTGGHVDAPRGQEVDAKLLGGQTVVPANGSGGGATYNIFTLSPDDFTEMVRDAIAEVERLGI